MVSWDSIENEQNRARKANKKQGELPCWYNKKDKRLGVYAPCRMCCNYIDCPAIAATIMECLHTDCIHYDNITEIPYSLICEIEEIPSSEEIITELESWE